MNRVLRWDDVDRTAGEFRLPDGMRGPRMVPLTTPALKVLDGIERNPRVISSRKPGIHLPDLTYYWNRIQAHAGLAAMRIHDLQHNSAIYQKSPAPVSISNDNNSLITRHFFPSVQARNLRKQSLFIPSFYYQMTPKIPLNTRCSISISKNLSINGRTRSSDQLGIWSYNINP